ncbi:translation initiation factor eIF3 subunit g [Parahypoxylon ruwenzoriense]
MVEPNVAITRSMGLEALQNRSRDLRRARPPDITILRNELKVPLRPEGLTKRESRIGLRNIFSKSKTGKDDRIPEGASFPRETSRHGGIRNSLAEIGNWPQRLQPSRSELSLLSSPPTSLKSPASKAPLSPAQPRQNSNGIGKSKLRPPVPPKTRGSVTTFDPPPLFKMYPQAIKHATLPTCVASIDALARLSESKSSLLRNESSRSDLALDQIEASGLERKGESERKKKSKSTPEWTSKIYALVTSGYLLQYAAEGPFDRLPEKILQLTRDSAAYATDLIPGRHWVIRVASFTDANGNPSSDTKSFRSKLALRGVEKRQISNMLLVFKSPEAMDAWLAILRREIESLGGKKKLSETGKAEVDDDATMLKAQASQRTLVVRDPDRFSRIVSQDFSWTQENALIDPNENDSANPRMSESTLDDGSTLSMVSLDGQRLDSLRDSGSGNSGNRFSFVSSGQPTIVSSPGSSPINSPIRECFPSHGDDYQSQPIQASLPPPTQEVRPRPNAAAIVNRRQSMQMMIPGFDSRIDIGGHSHSALPTTLPPVHEIKPQFVPNFSVPHTVNRRYSAMNLPRADRPQTSSPDEPESALVYLRQEIRLAANRGTPDDAAAAAAAEMLTETVGTFSQDFAGDIVAVEAVSNDRRQSEDPFDSKELAPSG